MVKEGEMQGMINKCTLKQKQVYDAVGVAYAVPLIQICKQESI